MFIHTSILNNYSFKIKFFSEVPLHTKFQMSRSKRLCETSPKSLVTKISWKICRTVKLFVLQNFLADTTQKHPLFWHIQLKMEQELDHSWEWSSCGSMPGFCQAGTGNLKCSVFSLPQAAAHSLFVPDSVSNRHHFLFPVR